MPGGVKDLDADDLIVVSQIQHHVFGGHLVDNLLPAIIQAEVKQIGLVVIQNLHR